ncbi:MAG TPA: hypothetical protein VGR37_09035 [Longimicrobiaceae bacterium]|nr:hypothetical protein [Longimicrobiaceae bacterium]
MPQRITKKGLPSGARAYRLLGGEEATVEVLLAAEPTDTSFPLLVRAWITEPDGTRIELPGKVINLNPSAIAEGTQDPEAIEEQESDEAAVRLERFAAAVRKARGKRRAELPTHAPQN